MNQQEIFPLFAQLSTMITVASALPHTFFLFLFFYTLLFFFWPVTSRPISFMTSFMLFLSNQRLPLYLFSIYHRIEFFPPSQSLSREGVTIRAERNIIPFIILISGIYKVLEYSSLIKFMVNNYFYTKKKCSSECQNPATCMQGKSTLLKIAILGILIAIYLGIGVYGSIFNQLQRYGIGNSRSIICIFFMGVYGSKK